jgi:hypothetical protein
MWLEFLSVVLIVTGFFVLVYVVIMGFISTMNDSRKRK